MFTKVFLKSNRFQNVCIFLLLVLFAALHIGVIALTRSTTVPVKTQFSNTIIEKRFRGAHDISKKSFFQAPESVEEKSERTFESFVIDEVLRVCIEVYPDLDPNYVLAIIYHESRFKPNLVNPKTNATGLMQILPKWHAERARRLGVDLDDPAGNILVGCDILNEVYQQSKSMRYALNVYAGGYSYANNYKNTKSQFEKELDEIIASGIIYSIRR